MKRVLFVCTGNICRSPTAEGVARHWAIKAGLDGEIAFDSAGTSRYHAGEPPDVRAQQAARKRGYDLSKLRARPVAQEDFDKFDLILAMDSSHISWLRRECPARSLHKLGMFMDFSASRIGGDVPDPYYGGKNGFEHVLDLCEDGVHGLLDEYR